MYKQDELDNLVQNFCKLSYSNKPVKELIHFVNKYKIKKLSLKDKFTEEHHNELKDYLSKTKTIINTAIFLPSATISIGFCLLFFFTGLPIGFVVSTLLLFLAVSFVMAYGFPDFYIEKYNIFSQKIADLIIHTNTLEELDLTGCVIDQYEIYSALVQNLRLTHIKFDSELSQLVEGELAKNNSYQNAMGMEKVNFVQQQYENAYHPTLLSNVFSHIKNIFPLEPSPVDPRKYKAILEKQLNKLDTHLQNKISKLENKFSITLDKRIEVLKELKKELASAFYSKEDFSLQSRIEQWKKTTSADGETYGKILSKKPGFFGMKPSKLLEKFEEQCEGVYFCRSLK
jgi:hypothetical protein